MAHQSRPSGPPGPRHCGEQNSSRHLYHTICGVGPRGIQAMPLAVSTPHPAAAVPRAVAAANRVAPLRTDEAGCREPDVRVRQGAHPLNGASSELRSLEEHGSLPRAGNQAPAGDGGGYGGRHGSGSRTNVSSRTPPSIGSLTLPTAPTPHTAVLERPTRQQTAALERPTRHQAAELERPIRQLTPVTPSPREPAQLHPRDEAGTGRSIAGPSALPGSPERSREQLHVPPSPPSSSHGAHSNHVSGSGGWRGRGGARPPPQPQPQLAPSQLSAWQSRVNAASNWYELRAMLVTAGGGGAAATDASPDAVLAVVGRLAAVTRYKMRPPEAADLGSFLERWLLQHAPALRHMGPLELSLTLHSLAKLPRAVPPPPPAWVAAWFSAAQPFLLQAAFRPKDLSLSLWALSRLELRLPPAALQLMLAAAEPHLARFNAQDLSLLALSLAALQTGAAAAPPPLLPGDAWQRAFLARCKEVLPFAGVQALSNLLHGIVRSGMAAPDWLLADVAAALYGVLDDAPPQALANVLSALAARRHAPPAAWVERFWHASAATMRPAHSGGAGAAGGVGGGGGGAGGGSGAAGSAGPARSCNAEDLGYLAAAAAELGLVPPRWWTSRLHAAMEAQLAGAGPRELSHMLHAAAALHRVTDEAAAAAAGAGAGARSGLGRPGAAGDRTWDGGGGAPSAADEPCSARPPRSLLAAWHRGAAAALPAFNAIDAASSLWALAALGERPPQPWLRALLTQVRGRLAAAPPSQLSVLLWSLAALRFRPTWSWIADCLEALTPGLAVMTGQDYAMATTALVRVASRPSGAWTAALLGSLQSKLGSLELRSLAQTAWALYRLRVQPHAGWLEALAAELRRRFTAAAAVTTAALEAGGEGPKLGRLDLRDTVLMLWVVSKWLGPQRRRRKGRRGTASLPDGGTVDTLAAAAAPLAVPPAAALSGLGRGTAPGVATVVLATGQTGPAVSVRLHRPALFPPRADGAAWASPAPVTPSTPAQAPELAPRICRLSGRMLRRRRALRPGSLVASLEGDLAAAAAFRHRVAASLLGPAMDLLAPHLSAATPQEAAMLMSVMRALPCAARAAAATRPRWVPALLAATQPQLAAMPPGGLLQLLAGLGDLGAVVEPQWAAAAAAAVRSHVAGPLPAAAKVALLCRLCRLQVAGTASALPPPPPMCRQSGAQPASEACRRQRGPPGVAAGKALKGREAVAADVGRQSSGRPWGPLVADAICSMRDASEASGPLIRLHWALGVARLRLRKLRAAVAAAAAAEPTAASAVSASLRHIAAAAAVVGDAAAAVRASEWASGSGGGRSAVYDADALEAATERVRGAVAAAAAVVLAAAPGSGGGTRRRRNNKMPRVPHIHGSQRAWVLARSRRTVAGHRADASPLLVLQLVELAASQLVPPRPPPRSPAAGAHATGAARTARPARPPAGQPADSGGAGPRHDAAAAEAAPTAPAGGRVALLWLAGATGRCWRRMLPGHRARAVRAWRRLLAAWGTERGAAGRRFRQQLLACLPWLTAAARGSTRARAGSMGAPQVAAPRAEGDRDAGLLLANGASGGRDGPAAAQAGLGQGRIALGGSTAGVGAAGSRVPARAVHS